MTNLIQPESSRFSLPFSTISSSASETFTIGKRLASLLEKQSIVALRGPLGAGKTCLAKGLARGLGIDEEVTSPTYSIVCEYEAVVCGEKIPVYHIDAYRLGGNDDFAAIGGKEIVFGEGISVIEWSERIGDYIPAGAFKVDFEIIGENKRNIRIYKDKNEYPGH